jgi:hypothetical protein
MQTPGCSIHRSRYYFSDSHLGAEIAPLGQVNFTGPGIRIYTNGFGRWSKGGPGSSIIRWIQWMVL